MKTSRKLIVALTMAAMLLTMLGTGIVSAAPTSTNVAFNDIAKSDFATAIDYLAAAGIVSGYPDGGFHPDSNVSRQEFAKVVVNFIGQGNLAKQLSANTPAFKDASKIQSWAVGYVNAAVSLGIIKGYPDGTFRPTAQVTQAEALAMLIRAIGNEDLAKYYGSAWPGNYLAAAAVLGISANVNVVAALPASRGEIAQMTYDAAGAHVYTFQYSNDGKVTGATKTANTVNTVFSDHKIAGTTVSAVSGNLLYAGGQKYDLADKVVVLGADDLVGTVGKQVNLVLNGDNKVGLIQVTTPPSAKTISGTLNDDKAVVPTYLATKVDKNYWHATDSGAEFVILSDGTVVQLASGYSIEENGKSAQLTDLSAGESVTVELNDKGLGNKISATESAAFGVAIVTTKPSATWDDNGTTFSAVYYNGTSTPANVSITFDKNTKVTFNGTTMSAKDAYSKIQSDVAAGTYPLIQVANGTSAAVSATISDSQVAGTVSAVDVTADGIKVTIGSTTATLASGYAHGVAASNPATFDTKVPNVGDSVVAELFNGKIQYLFGGTVTLASNSLVKVTGINYNTSTKQWVVTFDFEGSTLTLPYTGQVDSSLSTGYAYVTVSAAKDSITAVQKLSKDDDTFKVTALTVQNGSVNSWTLTNQSTGGTPASIQFGGAGSVQSWEVYGADGKYVGSLTYGAKYTVYYDNASSPTKVILVQQ